MPRNTISKSIIKEQPCRVYHTRTMSRNTISKSIIQEPCLSYMHNVYPYYLFAFIFIFYL